MVLLDAGFMSWICQLIGAYFGIRDYILWLHYKSIHIIGYGNTFVSHTKAKKHHQLCILSCLQRYIDNVILHILRLFNSMVAILLKLLHQILTYKHLLRPWHHFDTITRFIYKLTALTQKDMVSALIWAEAPYKSSVHVTWTNLIIT